MSEEEIQELTLINLLLPLIITTPIILYSIILLILLYKKKDKFPYTNLSYLWEFIYLILLILIQILITLDYLSSYNYRYFFLRIVGYIFSHTFYNFLFIIPNIIRSTYYISSMKTTMSHLSNLDSSKIRNNSYYDKRFTFKREGYIVKIVFYPLLIIICLLTCLSFIPHVECFLYNVNSTNMFFINSCNKTLSIDNLTVFIEIVVGIMIFLVMSIISIMISYRLYWFNIKDAFYIRLEIILLSFIWIVGRSSLYFIKLYSENILNIEYTDNDMTISKKDIILYKKNNFICFSVNIFIYNLLFIYLYIKRSYIDNSQIVSLLINFEKFLHNGICFNYFKNYLINNNKNLYKYLIFWLEGSIFKKVVLINCSPSNINSIKTDGKENKASPSKTSNSGSAECDSKGNSIRINKFLSEDKDRAKEIISIFIKSLLIKDNFSSSDDCMSVSETVKEMKEDKNDQLEMSINNMKLDLPSKIEEELNSLVETDFNIINRPKNNIDLAYIFDEAICYSYHKLHDSFISLKRNRDENYKLETLMSYIDFYEYKEEDLEKLRSTNSSIYTN